MVRFWNTLAPAALAVALSVSGCATEDALLEDKKVTVTPGRKGESTAERLHRHGVNCMDELERKPCAIDYFEQLVALDAPERELMGDAVFRLVKLYKQTGREADVQPLMRKYWELGMERGSSDTVPYAARYLPEEMTVIYAVSPLRLATSGMWKGLSQDAHDEMFTCDEARREELKAKRQARRDARKAAGEPAPIEGRDASRREGARKAREDEARARAEDRPDPIFDQMCELAETFGQPDMRAWNRFTTALDHWDPRRSALIVEMDGLAEVLARAEASGAIVKERERLWHAPELQYEGTPARLVQLDSDEVVMVPEPLAADLLTAFDQRDERLHPDMRELIEATPDDQVFFTAMTRPALAWGMAQAPSAAAAVLPEPKGMVISAAAYDYAGVFVRMHTPDKLKGALLIALIRLYMQGQAQEAGEEGRELEAQLLADMDLSQASDGSILFSSVLSQGQVEQLFMQ